MRRKLLFLMLFVGLLCLPVTVRAGTNLNINPGFEIDDDPADGTPDGWGIWSSGGGVTWGAVPPYRMYVNDPERARTGDWYVHYDAQGTAWGGSCGYQGPNKGNPPLSYGPKYLAPVKQGGTYYVGGYARDNRPGGEDSPSRPDSEVIYHDDTGVRVAETNNAGDPYRHMLFATNLEGGATGDPDFVFPRDGEFHLYYGLTKDPDLLPPEATYVAANCYVQGNCSYDFDDMYTGDSLPGSLVWAVNPFDGEKGVSPNQTTLNWGRQKVCDGERAIRCEVWWGEAADPNFWIQPHKKIMELTDTNSLDLSTIPAPLGGPIVLQPEEHYYWKIIYEEPNECFFGKLTEDSSYYFNTINDPPEVDAGLHVDRWMAAGDPAVTIGIDASYEDDGNPEGGTVTHEWDIVSGVVYSPHRFCQDPNVTISAVGDYELTLTVHDGVGDVQDKTGTDTILIRVFSNSDDRLRAHYPLDTNANDSVGGHNGTLEDDPVFNPSGQVAGAIELDGTDNDIVADGFGDFVSIDDTGSDPNNATWDVGYVDSWENSDLIDGMTISAWMKLDADGWSKQWETIAAKSTDSWEMLRSGSGTGMGYAIKGGIGSAGSGNQVVNDNQWHQVVGVYDRNTVKLYVDGIEAGSSNSGTIDLVAYPHNTKVWQVPKSAGKVLIGQTNNPSVDPTFDTSFGGLIDQVRIFDAAVPWWSQNPHPTTPTPGIVEMYRADGGHISCGGQYTTADIDEDCFTTLADFALLALDWLECTNVADVDCDLSHHEE